MHIAMLTLSLQSQLSHKSQERITFVQILNHNRLYTSILIHMLPSTLITCSTHLQSTSYLVARYEVFTQCKLVISEMVIMFKIYQKNWYIIYKIFWDKVFMVLWSDLLSWVGCSTYGNPHCTFPPCIQEKIAITMTKARHSHHNQSFCNFPDFWLTGINLDFHYPLQRKSQWDWEKKKK